MIILVTGGRERPARWESLDEWIRAIREKLDAKHQKAAISLLIQGGATGTDHIAGRWAHETQIPYLTIPAKWDCYGKGAGKIRNGVMLNFAGIVPHGVIAFPGGTGTADMVTKAEGAGLPVWKPYG
jgi:hypothetical protein